MPIIRLFFFALISLCFSMPTLQAQSGTVPVQGTVLDSLQQPLIGATIMVLQAQDSVMQGFALSDSEGNFRLEVPSGKDYKVQITFIGYGTFVCPLSIATDQKEVDLGRIILNPQAYQLEGLEITDSFIPIIIRNDTIQYNADAFKTKPNAVVEDLLRKLPGIEVEDDGTIRAQGEEVQNILVDGKEFFEDDPKVASKTIPAEIVDKVELYDKKSDFTEFTGIEDGNEEKTINLAIKEGKNKGVFGTLEGSYGYDKRYKGAANINRFTKQMQLSAIGNLNNLNEQPFSLQDYFQFMGGMEDFMNGEPLDANLIPRNLLDQNGISDIYSGGLNFNYDFSKRTTLRSNYLFNGSRNLTTSESLFSNILDSGNFTTTSQSEEESELNNHRFRVKLRHKIDASQDLIFRINGALVSNENQLNAETSSRNAESVLSNSSVRENRGGVDLGNWNSELTYRKKLDKKGRFLTAEAGADGKRNNSELFLYNQNTFFPAQNKLTTDQKQDNDQDNFNYDIRLNYVEPLGKTKFLNFGLSHLRRQSERKLDYFDQDDQDNYIFNDDLSNHFERSFSQHFASTSLKWVQRKFDLSFGLNYQITQLENINRSDSRQLETNYYHWLPRANFNYQFNSSKNLRLTYSSRIQVPAVEQIQPTIDNRDPLNIIIGNPDLQPEYIHQLNFNFSNFNQFYFRSLFAGLNFQYVQDRIINLQSIDAELKQVSTPVNRDGQWMLQAYHNYDRPIEGKNLKISWDGNISAQQGPFVVNLQEDRSTMLNLTQSIEFENKYKQHIDLAVGYSLGFTNTRFAEQTDFNQHFTDHSVYTQFTWFIGKDWTFDIDARWRSFSNSHLIKDEQFMLLDCSLDKAFFDNQLHVFLKGANLFNVTQDIQRSSFGNQIFETNRNRLGAYILLGVNYKLRSFGK